MQKRNLWIIGGVIAVVVIAAGAYLVLNKSSNDKTVSSDPYAQTSSDKTASTSNSTTPTPSSDQIIQTKTSSTKGQYLADADGNTLYTYGADTAGVSNCSGACLAAWPAYKASSTTALPTDVTVIQRSDGSSQYAYKGAALYTFVNDTAGQISGDGVSDFHLVKP